MNVPSSISSIEAREFLHRVRQPALALVETQVRHARRHEKTRFKQDRRNLQRRIRRISDVLAVEVAARCGLRSSGIREDDFYSHVWPRYPDKQDRGI